MSKISNSEETESGNKQIKVAAKKVVDYYQMLTAIYLILKMNSKTKKKSIAM